MIEVTHVSKQYPTRSGDVTVLNDINLVIQPGEKIGILGRNGAGKSTLIRLLSGIEAPSAGSIRRKMSLSWPIAFSGGFQGSLTGLDNLRFICRIYGVNAEDKIEFVESFSELGRYMKEPVKSYSSGMRARLAFALSMAVEFDCYLVDEVMAVGDQRFRDRCNHELFEKRGDRALILVSHLPNQIREHCNTYCVLQQGKLSRFDDADEAYEFYERAA